MANQLGKLVKKADAVANAASVLVNRTLRQVRASLWDLSDNLNLAGSADDRDYAYEAIRRKFAWLSRRLDALLEAQNELAAKGAAKDAAQMTGLEIKYSAARANAILELVTPAQGENLAAVFTQRMAKRTIDALREATVAALREQAVIGGTVKSLSKGMATRWAAALNDSDPKFVDAAGHVWDTKQYFQMNARTNTMRVYNDCLVDNVARETGSDLMRISTGGDPDCDCFAWEGCIISVSGKTKGFPTYEDARKGGCFHPNCTHTLEYVDEVADADEIELQKQHPVDADKADDPDAQDERRYEIDQARKMRDEGLTKEQARVAVDRDNLTDAIRSGLVRSDAHELVAKLTDEQVTRLCPDGNPPAFVPAKGSKRKPEPERWNHGSAGGVVHIKLDADLAHLLAVTKADRAEPPRKSGTAPVEPPQPKDEWQPTTELERATDALMAQIGVAHTNAELPMSGVNPEHRLSISAKYRTGDYEAARRELARRGLVTQAFSENCQRCVPTAEARYRGYDVTAMPTTGRGDHIWDGCATQRDYNFALFKNPEVFKYSSRRMIEDKMREWGDGARAQVCCRWTGGGAHTFMCVQKEGQTIFIDPQSNKIGYDPFRSISWRGRGAFLCNEFARIDNLEFNDKIKIACKAI